MKTPEQWLNPAPDAGRFMLALGAGLLLELCALALMLPFFMKPPPPAQIQAPVRLVISEAPPAPKPPPPVPQPKPPQPLPPKPVVKPPPVPVAPPLPVPPPPAPLPQPRPAVHREAVRRVVVHRPPPPKPLPVQPPPPVPVPAAPPPPPAPAAPSAGQVDLFRDAVRRAVQQVANSVYPATAQESGEVEITITYLNGRVTGVTLAHGSGYPLLDAAALQAGRIADYPPPPPAFLNQVFPWTIKVIFQPAAPNVDSD
jgi:protein TonB